tara:strand:+ start:29 stop:553 length:525 start_codon:yes stop_codon:yes gene_type:complete
MKDQNEVFVNVPKYEGKYRISTIGYVKSGDEVLTNKIDKHGCHWVYLTSRAGSRKKFFINRLMVMLFLNYNYKEMRNKIIVHIDGDKNNNNINNLQLMTIKQKETKYSKALIKPKDSPVKKKYIGVVAMKSKWRVEVPVNGKRVHIGLYKTKEEAIEAYNLALKDLEWMLNKEN